MHRSISLDSRKSTQSQVSHLVFDHTSVLRLIESVFNVPPVAARESSHDLANLLEVFDAANYQLEVPVLPKQGYVIPSSLCVSSITASEIAAPLTAAPLRSDEEPTVFLKMIQSGMLAGFPGHR
jgi:hypothetical protein